jgi:hypothetical protein
MAEDGERQRIERTARLMERGAELAGPMAGASVGLLGGPLGALAGAAMGFAARRALVRLGDEFARRQLGPRQQARAGGALYFALSDMQERIAAGENLRDDGFFNENGAGRSRADELLERVLQAACNEFEERKLEHLGYLVSSLAFRPDISAQHGHFLCALAEELTYGQLVLVALVHRTRYGSLPLWDALHPFDYSAHSLAGQVFGLAQRGVLFRTDSHPVREYSDADPARMRVGVAGHLLFELMRLDRIDPKQLEEAREQIVGVANTTAPTGLLGELHDAFDSATLAETDIAEGRIRIPLDDRVEALLPAANSEPFCMLAGEPLSVRYVLDSENVGVLEVRDAEGLVRLAQKAAPGERLLISRAHDGVFWLD